MGEPLTFLGLARRANRLSAGEDAVDAALTAGTVRLLVLACDAGEHTVRRAEHRSQGRLPIAYLTADKAALGQVLGWKSCSVAAMTDLGMALSFAKALAAQDSRHAPVLEALEETKDRIDRRKAKKPGKKRV